MTISGGTPVSAWAGGACPTRAIIRQISPMKRRGPATLGVIMAAPLGLAATIALARHRRPALGLPQAILVRSLRLLHIVIGFTVRKVGRRCE
jgi:hypothetical protein